MIDLFVCCCDVWCSDSGFFTANQTVVNGVFALESAKGAPINLGYTFVTSLIFPRVLNVTGGGSVVGASPFTTLTTSDPGGLLGSTRIDFVVTRCAWTHRSGLALGNIRLDDATLTSPQVLINITQSLSVRGVSSITAYVSVSRCFFFAREFECPNLTLTFILTLTLTFWLCTGTGCFVCRTQNQYSDRFRKCHAFNPFHHTDSISRYRASV